MAGKCNNYTCAPGDTPIGDCCFAPNTDPAITVTSQFEWFDPTAGAWACRQIYHDDTMPDPVWFSVSAVITPQPNYPCYGPTNVPYCPVPGEVPPDNGPYSGEIYIAVGSCPPPGPPPDPPPFNPGPGTSAPSQNVQASLRHVPLHWPRVNCERRIRLGM